MIRVLQGELAALIRTAAMEAFGQSPERIVFSRPPKIEMGDLATPCALELGKRLGKKPREVAQALAVALADRHPWVAKIEIAGPGYLNFHLDKRKVAEFLATRETPVAHAPVRGKVIVEHTNINPNKAAHIGHLRNAVLGDTLGRVLRALGEKTEIQNYIDDTGVQVADVAVGLLHKECKSAADAIRWIESEPKTLDKRCWDLYASVTAWYAADPAREPFRRDALHAIEHGEGDAHRVALALVPGILRCHLATMARLGITYDVLTHESVIIALGFFKTAFEAMKKLEVVHLESEGKNAGCWTMRLKDDPEFAGMEDADKIIVRSNGTVTYVGKDLAYQMWKLGLLGADFHYGKFRDFAGSEIAQTKPQIETNEFEGKFGHGDTVINVIDNRQSYLQKVIGVGLRRLGHAGAAARSIHFNYEMVALSPAAARQLGVEISAEEEKKAYLEMSGRRGLGVKADDLLDTLEAQAAAAVRERDPESPAAEVAERARRIAIAALRYYMIKYGKAVVLPFDFKQALAFEGETGPYLLYTAVRARNILRKAAEAAGSDEAPFVRALDAKGAAALEGWEPEAQALAMDLMELPKVADAAVTTLELSLLARHFFTMAQGFNNWYHKYPVIKEGTGEAEQSRRLAFVRLFERHFRAALEDFLSLRVPERM